MRWTHAQVKAHVQPMKLYFSPMACSLASRITIYEAQASAEPAIEFVAVDLEQQRTATGVDYRSIHALGQVPALEFADGELLTENAAILQYFAEEFRSARLVPEDVRGRTRLRQWLSFIGTELHKLVYQPLLSRSAPEAVKAYSLAAAPIRLSWLSAQLGSRPFLLDEFSVADAYLFTVLTWSAVTPIDLKPWPTLVNYLSELKARPAVQRALTEELTLYRRAS